MQQYKKSMENIQYSQQGKTNLYDKVINNVSTVEVKSKFNIKKFIIVTCIISVFTVTFASADGFKSLAQIFAPILGGEPTQAINITEFGTIIGEEVINNGIKITADATVSDGYNTYVVYSISKEDGSSFNIENPGSIHFNDSDSVIEPSTVLHRTHLDLDPYDNTVQIVDRFSVKPDVEKIYIESTFQDLIYYDMDLNSYVGIAEGVWELSFEITASANSKDISINQLITQGENKFTIENIIISPLGVQVYHDFNSTTERIDFFLTKTNGDIIHRDDLVFDTTILDIEQTSFYALFDEITLVEDFVSITFSDVTIPIW